MKRLTKGIEESKKEREKLIAEQENRKSIFKEIEDKACVVKEDYLKTQEVFVSLHCTPGRPSIYLHFLIRIPLFVFT